MGEADLEADMYAVTAADEFGIDFLPTLEAFLQQAIPQVLKFSKPSPDDEALMLVHGNSTRALGQIAWTISRLDFAGGQNSTILRVWTPTACTMWTEAVAPVLSGDTSDVGLSRDSPGLGTCSNTTQPNFP